MSASLLLLCLTVWGILYTAADQISFSVTQVPNRATVSRGGNITFHCIFPISQEHSWVRVYWWKQGENQYLRRSPDNRKRFGLKSKASGFFQLLSATIQDSGVYQCAVFQQGIIRGNGTGSYLIVHAAPAPLQIVSTEGDSPANLTLVCKTAAFFPENFTLTWYKNGVETALGIDTRKEQNSEGLYEVSSTLVETQPVLMNANFKCSVSHVSLETPAVAIHRVSKDKQGSDNSLYIWAPGCAVGGLAFLVLMIFIGRRCRLLKNDGKEECVTGPNRRQELGAEAEFMHYAALDLSRARKTPRYKREEERTVYAQTEQGTGRDKLTYATIALTGSEKTGKCKNIERTEYAQLRKKNQREVTEDVYTEVRINEQ